MDYQYYDNQNEYTNQDTYTSYHYGYNNAGNGGNVEPPKKKGGLFKKVMTFLLCGVIFGAAAGGTFLGVAALGNQYLDLPGVEETQKPTVSQTTGTKNSNISVTAMDVSEVVDDVMPSIVSVTSTVVYQSYYGWGFGMQEYETEGSGSGVIIGQTDKELLVLTNDHVVDGAKSLTLTFVDGTTAPAAMKGTDSKADLAVIAVNKENLSAETLAALAVAKYGDSDQMRVGQAVIAIGNALGFGQSVTVGVVSALEREVTIEGNTMVLMQTDAAINFGNSGGGLFNTNGELIGINVAKTTADSAEGMGYAIPISSAEDIIKDLSSKQTKEERNEVPEAKAAYIGISMQNVTSDISSVYGWPVGVYLVEVGKDTPAEEAGLLPQDVITAFDGEEVETREDLQQLLKYYEGGTTVELTVQRQVDGKYQEMKISLTLGFRKDYQ